MSRKLLHLFSLLAVRRLLLAQGTTPADPRSGPIHIPPQELRPASLLRGGGGPGRNPEGGGSSSGSPSSSGDRVRRRHRRNRSRGLGCREPSSTPPPSPPPAANVLNSYWHELQGDRTGSSNGSFNRGNLTAMDEPRDSDKDSAAGRFADAGGELASGQSVGEKEDEASTSRRPSAAPSQYSGHGAAETTTAAPSSSPAPSAAPTYSDPPSSCPDATPGQQVACQGGSVRFASLCHATQALGGSLTDCVLVDSAPLESNSSSNNEGGDRAGTPEAAAAQAKAADSVAPALAAAASAGAGAGAPDRGCPEDEDEDDSNSAADDDQVRLVLCDRDMLFASWCDALRHHFTREQCEEY